MRNYGLDLGKMFAMFGVVFLHALLLRGDLAVIDPRNVNFFVSWFFESLFFGSVDLFAMITGYLMWKKRAKFGSALYIYIQVFVITLICLLVACYKLPLQVDLKCLLEAVCPPLFGHGTYWYIAAYFLMYMFIPVMNFMINKMTNKQHRYLLAVILFAFCILPYFIRVDNLRIISEYSPLLLIAMYFFGSYAGKYPPQKFLRPYKYLIYALLCVVGTYVLTVGYDIYLLNFKGISDSSYKFASYTAPLVIASAYFFLRFFSEVKISITLERFLHSYSVATFGVYVIHCNYFVYTFLFGAFCKKFFPVAGPFEILIVLIIVLVTFFACLILDRVRYALFELFQIRQFCNSVENRLMNWLKARGKVIQ